MGRALEVSLALTGAADCLLSSLYFWRYLRPPQYQHPSWPFPRIWLIELAALGVTGLAAIIADSPSRSPRWGVVTWSVGGGLSAFVVLGVLSIGPFYLPA